VRRQQSGLVEPVVSPSVVLLSLLGARPYRPGHLAALEDHPRFPKGGLGFALKAPLGSPSVTGFPFG